MASSSLTQALRETLALFEEAGASRTTTEVADSLDLGRRSTYERLERLVDEGPPRYQESRWEWTRLVATARGPRLPTPDWEAAAESLIDDVLDDAEVGVFVLDSEFEVAWINEATERYFGFERERVLGRDKRALVDESIAAVVEDSATFADTVLATYDDNTYTERFECHVTPGDGRDERWLEHRSEPIESGAYAGGRVELYYDVTDRKREESAHQTDRKQFESLVDAVEEYAIFLLDPDGRVQTWNTGAARASRGTTPTRSSVSTCRRSTPTRTALRASRPTTWRKRPKRGVSKTRDGACVPTDRGSGRTSLSRRFETTMGPSTDTRGSPAT